MADSLTEDDEELVAVETPPAGDPEPAAEQAADDADDADEGDDGDEEDARLADDHSEDGDDGAEERKRKRAERRERQRRARENAERELEYLRGRVAEYDQRFRALEGQQLSASEAQLAQAYQQKMQEAQTAEAIMAKALEAGNGEDHVLADRIRQQAYREAESIRQQAEQLSQHRQQVTNPGPDPRMLTHAQEWLAANPWYDPNGGDEDSAITRAIDIALTREGYDPRTRTYWEELTRRASERIGSGARAPAQETREGRRKPPPQGVSRGENAPRSTRQEIYVTPERKQAMIDAGYWDDPVKRNQMLKEYQQFDKANAARS